jgi:hypothetical protein
MDYISTTALANELDIKPAELFDKLKGLGWIEKKNDKWTLTEIGKQKGGQTRTNPKFGEFVVWPENISLNGGQQQTTEGPKFLSSTALSKNFDVSAQRINLILSELGFIEKDVAGWEITKLGKSVGGRQREHETSGNYFVIWPPTILQNKRLLEFFGETPTEQKAETKLVMTVSPSNQTTHIPSEAVYHDTFRERFPAKHRTFDGHYVRSISEMSIDNFLYINGIVHAYERKLPIEEDVYCDFYIPSGINRPQVYIEFWGIEDDPKYLERKKKKIEIYKKYEFPLIELSSSEINNLEEVLTRKLIQHKISLK